MLYYQNYEIPEKDYLSSEEMHVLYACCWMVDNCSTIRETAVNCKYSATTLWRRIHNECRQLSPELYRCVVRQMHANSLFPKRKKKIKNVKYVREKF